MPEKTIFEMIIDRQIPAKIIYEDADCICFHDVAPQAPIHLLIVPKKHIIRISEASNSDQDILGHLLLTAKKIAQQEGFAESGFRTIINNGKNAGETVPHLHLHLMAGREMLWPPG